MTRPDGKAKPRGSNRLDVTPDPGRLRRGDVLISSKEVLSILDVPASSLTRLVKSGALVPVAYPAAGMIFRVPDVEHLARERAELREANVATR